MSLPFGETHYTHGSPLHPGVQVGSHKLSGKPDEMLYCNPGWGNILSIEVGNFYHKFLHVRETGISFQQCLVGQSWLESRLKN